MRLLKYLSYAQLPEKTNTFRAMSIKLVDKPKDYSDVVSFVQEKYDIPKVQELINKLNKELKNFYKGEHKFALCLTEGITPNKIKIKSRYETMMKSMFYESNDKLSKIKKVIEEKQM
jgi:hypothetical protein